MKKSQKMKFTIIIHYFQWFFLYYAAISIKSKIQYKYRERMGKSILNSLYSYHVIFYLALNYDAIGTSDVSMKKISKKLSIALTITILFSAIMFISNVAAQEGDPQGDPDDADQSRFCLSEDEGLQNINREGDPQGDPDEADQLRNCLADDEGFSLKLLKRDGALETPRDRDQDGDPIGDPFRNRDLDPIDAEI